MFTRGWARHLFVTLLILLIVTYVPIVQCVEVVYAINAGGEAHVDSYGVRYMRDPLMGKVGTASDYGKQLLINRVNSADHILYQTERYHHSTFGYDIPISQDGEYVMILKFCEVYFNSPNMKVPSLVYSSCTLNFTLSSSQFSKLTLFLRCLMSFSMEIIPLSLISIYLKEWAEV
jgi:hypothetical protein